MKKTFKMVLGFHPRPTLQVSSSERKNGIQNLEDFWSDLLLPFVLSASRFSFT
jgi:hypothetical protein